MVENNENGFWLCVQRAAALVVLLALVVAGVWGGAVLLSDPEVAQSGEYATACYREQGGARWVCGDGGTLAVEAGGALDVAGTADFTGATVTGFSPSSLDSDVTITGSLIVSGTLTAVGAITGDVTGDVTGNVSGATYVTATTLYGDLVGDVTGDVTAADYVTATTLYVGGGSDFDGAMNVDANGDFDSLSTLSIDSSAYTNSTGDIALNGNVGVTGTLTLESVAFSGPVRFGSATSVVSGTTIAHGLGITPTVALLTPGATGGYTATVYILASNAVSITIGVQDGVTVPTLYWLAGK